MGGYLQYILDGFVYTITDAVVVGLGIAILIRIITWVTPLKAWDKIKENSIATAIVWGIILTIFGVFTISGYFVP